MFGSTEELSLKLATAGYFIDHVMIQVVFLAARLQKPLLLEGPAGSGNAQVDLYTSSNGENFTMVGTIKARFGENLSRAAVALSMLCPNTIVGA